jgi:excisionase family DNA binding protein
MSSSSLWTARQVAQHLNVRLGRVYELARRGVIPKVCLGRHYRFDPDRIQHWLEAGGFSLTEERSSLPE